MATEEGPLKFNGKLLLSVLIPYPLSSIPLFLSYLYLLPSILLSSFLITIISTLLSPASEVLLKAA
jgi:hypothetical protein